jgi:tripartite-type tricarboxylate transporter receptor subunit TctC
MAKDRARRNFILQGAAAAAALMVAPAMAADYPNRLVKLVLGVPAGQGSDTTGRTLAKQLSSYTGQPFVIENLPGGNQVIAARAVLRSPADGYTFFLGSQASMAANVAYYKDVGYDAVKNFTPVALLASSDWIVVVGGESKYKSLGEVMDAALKDPRLLSIGVYGSSTQLGAALLAQAANVESNIILYKGSPQVVQDVAGGQLVMGIVEKSAALAMAAGGKIRPLAAISEKRLPQFPELPTVRELQIPMPVLNSWIGLFAPAGTPKELRDIMAGHVRKALRSDEFAQMLNATGFQNAFMTPDELAEFQVAEIARYRQAMVAGRIQPQ